MNYLSIKKKIENIILSRSNSYQFYKKEYEKNIKNKKNATPDIEALFNEIKEEFNDIKSTTDGYMDSSTYLLRTLLVDYELNDPKGILKCIHEISEELLVFIINICKNNNIVYWLDASSLLGAVRHEDFIPWDDEIDLGMMRKDYINFNQIIEKEISNYGLDDVLSVEFENNGNLNPFTRIIIKSNLIINDEKPILTILNVFPYDFLEEYNKKTRKMFKDSKSKFYNNLNNNVSLDDCLKEYYKELNVSLDETGYVLSSVDGRYPQEYFVFRTEGVFPLNQIKFRDIIVNSPNDTHYYLKKIYKDYLTLPRIVNIHDKVDSFRYTPNYEEIFNEVITKLHEVNSKF